MRVGRVVAVALAVSLGVAGCSDDADDATVTTDAAAAPEDVRAPAAEVTTGLRQIETIASAVAAAGADTDAAKAQVEEIEPVWARIEGTVKANDEDAYVSFEDSFALLEKAAEEGDAARSQQGSADVAKAVSAYLAEYPG